jgi:hypothetical protein
MRGHLAYLHRSPEISNEPENYRTWVMCYGQSVSDRWYTIHVFLYPATVRPAIHLRNAVHYLLTARLTFQPAIQNTKSLLVELTDKPSVCPHPCHRFNSTVAIPWGSSAELLKTQVCLWCSRHDNNDSCKNRMQILRVRLQKWLLEEVKCRVPHAQLLIF